MTLDEFLSFGADNFTIGNERIVHDEGGLLVKLRGREITFSLGPDEWVTFTYINGLFACDYVREASFRVVVSYPRAPTTELARYLFACAHQPSMKEMYDDDSPPRPWV